MATTRLIPLHTGKERNFGKAIRNVIGYVSNPKKTQQGELVTGFGCNPETADGEFLLMKREYIARTGRLRGKDDVIAYHLRQSFVPGEITPEEANRIGCELASRFTHGQHAYVVATHEDRRHVHSHIIISAVNLDCDRKFRNFWGSSKAIRRLSDTLCIQNGLSIIEQPKGHSKSYNKWLGNEAKTSQRDALREAIDAALARQPKDFEELYSAQLERVSANTVIHYHAVIHRALKYAVKIKTIQSNPAVNVERPRKEKFIGSFYDKKEINTLFDIIQGHPLEVAIKLAAFYGLRREEIIGLKWTAIDFENNTLTIQHTVTECNLDGKHIEVASDTAKTDSSLRTMPLVTNFRAMLLAKKEKQEHYRKLCGRSYCKEYLDYIFVNEMGERWKPRYLSDGFKRILEQNGLRRIRFHDLRHTCASLLLANNVPMKKIQEWLGHSDFSTTANIYAHLDFQSKISSAEAMLTGLDMD